VTEVMAEALSRLPVPPLTLHVNHRKLIQGFYLGLGVAEDRVVDVIRVVDKLDKIGSDGVHLLLVEQGLGDEQAATCLALASIRGTDTRFADDVRALGVKHELLDEGVDALVRAMEATAHTRSENFSVIADLQIARGLDYYTGLVFEGRMEMLGTMSICAGGRYDALASDDRSTFPGVGISLGITRLVAPLVARGLLDADRSVPSVVLVALPDESARDSVREIARSLRARGIATEVAPTAAKYGRQIRHADRRGIPYVWFPADPSTGESDSVRDIRSGDQVPADVATWSPPVADLTPRIVNPADQAEQTDQADQAASTTSRGETP
jgi:histidyl-tRNA synthetase